MRDAQLLPGRSEECTLPHRVCCVWRGASQPPSTHPCSSPAICIPSPLSAQPARLQRGGRNGMKRTTARLQPPCLHSAPCPLGSGGRASERGERVAALRPPVSECAARGETRVSPSSAHSIALSCCAPRLSRPPVPPLHSRHAHTLLLCCLPHPTPHLLALRCTPPSPPPWRSRCLHASLPPSAPAAALSMPRRVQLTPVSALSAPADPSLMPPSSHALRSWWEKKEQSVSRCTES